MSNLELYEYIKDNRKHFIMMNQFKCKDDKYIYWLNKENIHLPISNVTEQNIFDYLLDNTGKYCICGTENRFQNFGQGYQKFCSKRCLYEWRSNNMIGDNNNSHKMTDESRKNALLKQSKTMKAKIARGEWTPNVTNSWAKSRCKVNINQNGKDIIVKCRSSWDAYFQLYNPNLLYEKIRVPYFIDGEFNNYIIDFVDINNKIIYEIKPDNLKDTILNKIKFKAAKDWAKLNEFEFRVISNKWFKDNYNDKLLENQIEKDKLKRLLKQFYEN